MSELREFTAFQKTPGFRKGFVYTLEAIIASTLFLGMAIVVVPELQPEESRAVQDTVKSGLEVLDKTGELENRTLAEIETSIDTYVPAGYNHSTRKTETETEEAEFSAPEEFYIDTSGNNSELQLWISSANDLNATFKGEKILESRSSSGYELLQVSGQNGFLNFTGTGEGSFEFDTYATVGAKPNKSELKSTSYILGETEVQIFLWTG